MYLGSSQIPLADKSSNFLQRPASDCESFNTSSKMAALTKARKQDTSRKNSLIRLLDSIPQLLEDLSVSPERLVEARKNCKAVWEQFALAHDA